MVAVAIVALLASLAYPSYLQQIRKGRRADAKQALLDLAARQERFYTVNNRWATTPADLGYAPADFPLDVQSAGGLSYRLTINVDNSTGSYTATAAPQGPQQADTCASFILDHMGLQSVTGNDERCW
nr:type IV pilin protein [Ramlibacter aquaticus]